jgi:F0F1-type ATP synthase assembly protein I
LLPGKKSKIWYELGPYLNLGWQLAITIVLMVFLGKWLDDKFDTSPTFIVIFSIFGIFAGMYNFLREVLRSNKRKNKRE